MKHFYVPLMFLLAALCACNTKKQAQTTDPEAPTGTNHAAIAVLVMERMDLQAGENVLLVGAPGRFDALVNALQEQIAASDATYLGCISITDIQPEAWTTDFVAGAVPLDSAAMQDYLRQADVGIMLPGASSGDLVYGLMQNNLKEGKGRTIHFHWSGAYDLNGNGLELTPEIDAFYEDVVLNTDYAQLAAEQQQFEQAMRGKVIRVTTPAGTDISFEIGDRPVTMQNGDASAVTARMARNLIDREIEIPAGAIRVAPIESSVSGTIAFPDAKWFGEEVSGLVLTFEQGKVVDMKADSGLAAVQQVMETYGESAQSFREFALGFNPRLAIPEADPWIPYYGYGAGIVRLSLGDNNELGGNVSGGYVRWNFFTDATVQVGDEVWVKGGKRVDK